MSHDLQPEPARFTCFGPAPLFEGEDSAGYDDLLARVSGAIKPADIIEEIWIRDIVGLTWEALRLRRVRAALLTAKRYVGVKHLLSQLCGTEAYDLSEQWARREGEAIAAVDRHLATAGLTMDAVMAETMSVEIALVEKMDRMIASAAAATQRCARSSGAGPAWPPGCARRRVMRTMCKMSKRPSFR
jgi:hypothetical protein